MRKNLLALGMCVAMIACALQVNADPTMVASYKVGDSMGAVGVTAKSINLYDGENKIIRTYNLATDYNGETYVETIIYYNYDANGTLLWDLSSQYRPAYGDWVDGDKNIYQYDEQGRLIQYDDFNRGYQYFYDEQGNLYRERFYSNTTATEIQNITHFDFDENGNPARSESDGFHSDYRFDAVYTYDEMGRTIDVMRHCVAGTVHSRTTNEYDANNVTIHTYNYISAYGVGGRETGEVGAAKDVLVDNQHIERTDLGNGWYQKVVWTWDKIVKQYLKGGSPFNELYVNLDGAYAPLNVVVENISTPEQPNTAKVTADVPASLPADNMSYIIWRGGAIAGIVSAVDGKIEFIDQNVANGTYEYIVQTYDAANDVYYNCSDVVTADITTPLSPAENIRIVGGYHGTYNDPEVGEYETFFIKLAWDVKPCDEPVLGYKVWVYPWAYPMLEIDGDVKNCELSMVDDEVANIRVDVVYEHGVKEGVYMPLFWDNSADFDGEPIVKYYLTKEESYGDHMGTPGASSLNYYMYDNNNNLSRRIDYKFQTDGQKVPTYHYFYEYNNNAQLISEFYRQMNANGEWSKNKMPFIYTYDAMGRMITKEDTVANNIYYYEYDEQGHLVSMINKGKTFGATEYDKLKGTTTYSQFDENGNPGYSEFVHPQYASSSYNTTYTYDAQGRILVEEQRDTDGMAYRKYDYTYDKYGILIEKLTSDPWYEGGKPTERFVYRARVTREPQGDMTYKCYEESFNSKNSSWTNNGRYTIETYSPLNSSLTPQNLVVTDASTIESPNTIEIECNYPQIKLANAQYIIWRGCFAVDTVEAPANQGIIRFRDENVENGTYEYIVQTYDAATQKAFNATAPCVFTLQARLDPVENLRYFKTTEGVYNDPELGELSAYWVHFEWDAPQSPLEIVRYNIYQDGYKVPVSTTVNTNDSVWVYREDEENADKQTTTTTVEVRVLYSLGESLGVTNTFMIERSALENVSFEGSAYVAGKTLFTEPNADVVIYNATGAVVAAYSNKQQVALDNMPAGVYVAVVTIGNHSQVLKVAL